ncbi:hypothetical protein [Streptomyces sp. NPDC006134]|uniref:hypothetical protein n=1 Tax=Streptomyces sp. NPDC006134 TaxID=3154467 RepID=UPI0033F95318
MKRRTHHLISTAVTSAVLAASAVVAQPAHAATSYESDGCTSTDNRYCFAIFYNSRSENTWLGGGSCYIANKSVPDHYGYSPNGAVLVRLVFAYQNIYGTSSCKDDSGEGQPIKNNAASVANGECSVMNTVYFNSGYLGTSQSFYAYCGEYTWAENLKTGLKNENASHKRS